MRVLRRHPSNVVDRWDGRAFRRVLVTTAGIYEVRVVETGQPAAPRLEVEVFGPDPNRPASEISRDLQRILGTQRDLSEFYRLAAEDSRLAALAEPFRGFKPPRFPSLFEALVSAIACQQVTLTLGILLLNRLAGLYGPSPELPAAPARAFPRPEDLSAADPETLRAAGFSRQKARAIIGLARAVVEGTCDLEAVAELDDEKAIARLTELRGVGRWTAEYALLRGLGRTHVFPQGDAGARNGLRQWLAPERSPDLGEIDKAMAPWRAFQGLIYFHLLLRRRAWDAPRGLQVG